MLSLEKAIQRCFDRANLDPEGEGCDIMHYMYQYKAIRDLPEDEFDQLYNDMAFRLGFCRG